MWKMLETTLGANGGDDNYEETETESGQKPVEHRRSSDFYFQSFRDDSGFKPVEIKKKDSQGAEGLQFSQITVMETATKGKGGKRNRKGGKKQGQVIAEINL